MNNRYLKLLEELKHTKAEPLHKDSRVLVVDGLNTFIRSFAASPVTNDDGLHIGGISGTLLSIGHAIKTVDPTRVVIVFDGKNGSKRRREKFPDYKANRKFKIRLNRSEDVGEGDDGQLRQLMRLVEYMSYMPFSIVTVEGVEADDVIGYLATEKFKEQCYIMSSDKDFLQLVDDRVRIWSPTKKRLYYTQDIVTEYGIHPNNFVLYRALTGDKSDNIPGIDGLGLKTLLKLYPQLAEETKLAVDDIVNIAANNKGKMFSKLANSKDIITRNLDLMQLSEAFIPTSAKLKVLDQVDNPNRLVKYKFQSMLFEDRMTTAIKNVDMWTREVLQKIDGYLLD